MTVRRDARPPAPSGAVRFDERLSVPWWWWPLPLVVVALVAISVRVGHPEVPWEVPVVVLVPLFALWLWRLGRFRVTVRDSPDGDQELRVGTACLPARFIAGARWAVGEEKRRMMGPELDPRAFVVHRPWIGPVVRVDLNDPDDPTPYWLFSVRRPEALLRCLRTPRMS